MLQFCPARERGWAVRQHGEQPQHQRRGERGRAQSGHREPRTPAHSGTGTVRTTLVCYETETLPADTYLHPQFIHKENQAEM